jgi:ribokinase
MAKAKNRIVVIGGLNMDVVTVSKGLPGLGEYMYCDELHFIPGGNGLNQAVAAARLGSSVHSVGFVGDDGFGKELVSFLQKENVNVSDVRTIPNVHSGTVVFLLANKEERHLVYPGSNMSATVKELDGVKILPSDIVISQLTIPQDVIMNVFQRAKKVGAKTMLNLFPNYDVSRELLKLCDYIILNEVELAFRIGSREFINAQHKTLHMDHATVLRHVEKFRADDNQVVITTLAERGAVGVKKDTLTAVDGIKVNFVDATGAGDCFLGAFATGMAEGMDFKNALEFANCAAALSVQKIGATSSFPSRNEVDAFMKKQK